MKKVDEEILSILKDTFRSKKGEFINHDDAMREFILKTLFLLSIVAILGWLVTAALGRVNASTLRFIAATPLSLFLGLLSIHINNKSENFSVIVSVISWVSMTLALFFS